MDVSDFLRTVNPWVDQERGPVGARLGLAIRHAISNGLLVQGDRLPPERALAQAWHVSRPTISAVVDDLRTAGLLRSRQGSGTWVAASNERSSPSVPFVELIQSTGLIDLASATAPDAGMLPSISIGTADLIETDPANGLSPAGLPMLCTAIAEHVSAYLPALAGENVVITSGAHQALALLLATFVRRGDVVLVEDTTYGGLVDMIAANGAKPVAIDRDDDGPVPAHLAALLERHRPAMTVLISSVHSPTGVVSSDHRCDELAEILADGPGHVVLDETYAEVSFAPPNRRLARNLGTDAIHVGSLSKALWTGLRTGWIVASETTCQTIIHRRCSQFDLGPGVASQLFAREALRSLPDLIPTRRKLLRERARWLTDAVESAFPEWSVVPAMGGLALWVDLGDRDGQQYALAAAERGVAVLPGWACRADQEPTNHIRMCFDRPVELLDEAVERMASLARPTGGSGPS